MIEAFRVAHWEINVFSPVKIVQADLSALKDADVIIFALLDDLLLNICKEICHKGIAPKLVIVANLAYAQPALEADPDDFLVVPMDPVEVLLCVDRIARTSTFVCIGELEIDLAVRRVRYDNCRVRLSSIEFRLLACLAKQVGQTVRYAEIVEDVWGWDPDLGMLAQAKNCFNQVQKKIEPDLHNPEYSSLFHDKAIDSEIRRSGKKTSALMRNQTRCLIQIECWEIMASFVIFHSILRLIM